MLACCPSLLTIVTYLALRVITPPFGFALFYLRGVATPEIKTGEIYRGAIPFILLQLIVLVVILAFPENVIFYLRYQVFEKF